MHRPSSARVWQIRRSYGYCAGPDCWLQRLLKKNLLKRNSAPRTQVYARRGRRGWTGRRTTSYPCKHCRRLREMTVLQMLELWFCSVLDDRASFFADDLCLTLIPCALVLLLSLLLPPPAAVSTRGPPPQPQERSPC